MIGKLGIGFIQDNDNILRHPAQKILDFIVIAVGTGGVVGVAEEYHSGLLIDGFQNGIKVEAAIEQAMLSSAQTSLNDGMPAIASLNPEIAVVAV